jgi:predicted TIM-barrel fold metal-dependent hydrolase
MTDPNIHCLSRREALKAAGRGVTALAAAGWTALGRTQPSGRIDIHHHWHPPPIRDAFGGLSLGASWPGGDWTIERALDLMDRFGIATGILSVRNPRTRVSASLCREVNELAARLIVDHPDRFGALAFIPQFDFERAVNEAVFALDELELDGVLLHPSVDNVYLGVPEFDPLMAALDERNAVVLIHPTSPFYLAELSLNIAPSVMEYVFETTRAIMNLVVSGTLEKYPNIRFITAHAGGAAPYIAARLNEQGERTIAGVRERAPDGILSYLKSFYFGTAQAMSTYSLNALLELVDVSRVVFGTDLPISSPELVNDSDGVLRSYAGLAADDLASIERENALGLLPRLRG